MTEPGLIGAEMLEWSDEPVGGDVLAELIRHVIAPGARVLLAGPHATHLTDVLADRCTELTCVVRGLPDATELAARYPEHVTVLCGSFDKLGDVGPFDAVVALDGLDRLTSAGGYVPAWGELADRLAAALAPGGVLLLGLANRLGLHRLLPGLAAQGPGQPRSDVGTDAAWPLPDGVRPATPGQMLAALTERGLAAGACYGGYPHPYRPSVLVDITAIGRHATAIVRATGGARPVVEAGLGAQLAPAWIVVAQRGVRGPGWPEALVADGLGRWCVVYEERGGGRRLLRTGTGPLRHGPLSRDPAALAGPVPGGFTLAEVMVAACEDADLPLIRELMASYAGWLDACGASPFATMDNVLAVEHALVDTSWSWDRPVAAELVLARAIRRFVTRLLAEGRRHPWPRGYGADAICGALHAMAARPADPATLEAGLRLEAEITALTGSVPIDENLVHLRRPDGDLKQARDRAAVLEEQRRWLMKRLDKTEANLRKRSADLATTRDQLNATKSTLRAVRRSTSFKLGRALTRPFRRARGPRR